MHVSELTLPRTTGRFSISCCMMAVSSPAALMSRSHIAARAIWAWRSPAPRMALASHSLMTLALSSAIALVTVAVVVIAVVIVVVVLLQLFLR